MSLATPTTLPSAKGAEGRRHFGQFPLQRRVLLSQMPLAISTVVVAIAVLVIEPGVATGSPHFVLGLGGIGLLTVLAGVVPWHRFHPVVYWVIPLLDFVAIAPLWTAARYVVDGMSLLSAFPVFWLAWSGIYPALALTLGFLGSAAVTWWPYLPGEAPFPDELVESALTRPVVVPFLMLALGVAASILTRSMDKQRVELRSALDRAASQNRMLQAVVETSDVGILVVDGRGNDILMNQAQRRTHFIGLPPGRDDGPEDELLLFEADGVTPIPPEERPVTQALQGKDYRGRIIAIGTDGSQQHLSVSASSMYDEEDHFDGTVVVFQNVTDLMDAIQTRERFVAEVSHEFRTPLTSIIGYLDVALDEDLDPIVRKFLITSQRNADRLLGLVTSLLDSAADSSTVTVQEVNLARLVQNSVESVEVQAKKAGLRLTADLPDRMGAEADPVKMSQVVDNLLSNAIKYTPAGGSVTVALRRLGGVGGIGGVDGGVDGGGDWAELTVRDTGFGMTKAERERLFTNFYRTEHVRKAAIPGTGLGLAITQGFVRAHGGEILVSSEKDVGSTFTVRIPIAGSTF
ncbi:sensor histidine kinase [Citricoccus muralis]|uniref:histidine kinase n=1 Tax=Citricoccus muralis TaxID=169134 RepID=A0A3D9LC34_9MICC|nr:PAS domain-containing sensor histidine kinase [Citricoccus muralis]REE03712.1 signal transduction histidine kinase [Citricoccus muralis]